MRKQGLQNALQKGDRNWILPKEFDDFLAGIKEAIKREKQLLSDHKNPGPFRNILKYEPGQKEAGLFPPTKVWQVDMFRVLYGLDGEIGEMMRKSELSVYNGVPFSSGLNGQKLMNYQLQTREEDQSKKPKIGLLLTIGEKKYEDKLQKCMLANGLNWNSFLMQMNSTIIRK